MSEDKDEFNSVYGVKFRQPPNPYGLNDESITDDWLYVAVTVMAVVPIVGFAFAFSGLSVGYEGRDRNAFRISEQIWKTGVYGMLLQIIGLAIGGLVYLAV